MPCQPFSHICNLPSRPVVNGRNCQMRRDITQKRGPWHNFKTCIFVETNPLIRHLGVSLECQTTNQNHQYTTSWNKMLEEYNSYFVLFRAYIFTKTTFTQIMKNTRVKNKCQNNSNNAATETAPRAAGHGVNTCAWTSSASAIMAWPQGLHWECPGYQEIQFPTPWDENKTFHGNPQPSFLGVIHILGVQNIHFSWFWGPRVVMG